MTTAAASTGPPPVVFEDRIVDLTADQFLGMAEAGLFPDGSRAYLWGGRIVEKMARSRPHATTAFRVSEAIRPRLPEGWLIWSENPIRLDDRHVPLPDLAVIRGPIEVYEREDRHPSAADVALVVEVACTGLAKDLGPRAEVFARAGVPAYWVLDVVGGRLVEHRRPGPAGPYEEVRTLGRDESVRMMIDARKAGVVAVRELLP